MSTTAHLAGAPAGSGPAPPWRRYQLTTTAGADVLSRVIGLIRRRSGEVVALEFRRGDRHRPPTLEVVVAIDPRVGGTLGPRLAGLVDVLDVREG